VAGTVRNYWEALEV